MSKTGKNIVWIASYPKSGNTWFRILLENYIAPPNSGFDINQMQRSSIASSRALIDQFSGISCADLNETEIEELRPKVYEYLAMDNDDLVFLKVHDAWKKTPSGGSMFPKQVTKGVIYLVRNPLDIAVSFSYHSSKNIESTIKNMNNRSYSFCNDQTKSYHQVKQLLSDWSGHIISWLDNSHLPILALRYEDMLEDTSKTFKQALEFLEINIDEKQLQAAITSSSFGVLNEMERKEGFREKPMNMDSFFRNGSAGQWRKILKPKQIEELINCHRNQMQRFNYIPDK